MNFTELRSEGADNARLRPLGVAAVPSSMPYERGRNRPAASDLAAVPPFSCTDKQTAALSASTPPAEWPV